MTIVATNAEPTRVTCARCGLATPSVPGANADSAAEMARNAGWKIELGAAFCPQCLLRPIVPIRRLP